MSQRITTVLIIIKKLGTICKKFSGIQSDHLTNAFKKSNVILTQKQPKIWSVWYLNLDLILTSISLHKQSDYLNMQIVCCM